MSPRSPDAASGREVFERLVQPLVAGIYTADPERLSMAATLPQFQKYEVNPGSIVRATLFSHRNAGRLMEEPTADAERADIAADKSAASGARYGLFVAPKAGMASLVTTLTQHLPRTKIHFGTRVCRLERSQLRWQVITDTMPPSTAPQNVFDGVVCAVPAYAAAAMLSTLDEELSTELNAIEYAGCAIVSFGYRRDQIGHALDGFGFVVPQSEGRRIIAGSFASLKFPGRAGGPCFDSRLYWGRRAAQAARTVR